MAVTCASWATSHNNGSSVTKAQAPCNATASSKHHPAFGRRADWSLAANAEAEHTRKPPKAVLHQDGATSNAEMQMPNQHSSCRNVTLNGLLCISISV